MRPTQAVISTSALRNNISVIRDVISDNCKIMAIVKADCYGHSVEICIPILIDEKINYFGVATIEEAIQIRNLTQSSIIVVLTPPISNQLNLYFQYNIECVVSNKNLVDKICSIGESLSKSINVHLLVNTGMTRNGCEPSEVIDILTYLKHSKEINIIGLCSHFSCSDEIYSNFTLEQITIFDKTLKASIDAGFEFRDVHIANSGGIMNYPSSHYNLVRPGLSLYGLHPTFPLQSKSNLKQILTFKSAITNIKKVLKNTPISYSKKYITTKDTFIASVPVGYADGLMRCLTNKLDVFINGKKYKVAGTICMDEILIDIGNDPIKVEDEVIICSNNSQTAWDLALVSNTIPYEICTNISKRVSRIKS
ncbi:MAG: alanine racemase [Chlorobiota bacterium]|nr:alanine racemase [Chlorobiota bacterium]QQS67103.1 MAG: alanine racemase [Chlorobiota bacterium]